MLGERQRHQELLVAQESAAAAHRALAVAQERANAQQQEMLEIKWRKLLLAETIFIQSTATLPVPRPPVYPADEG